MFVLIFYSLQFQSIVFFLIFRSHENLIKDFQKTVGFLRSKKISNIEGDSKISDFFFEEIEKFQKDKMRQEKLGEIYQNSEKKREDLLNNLDLKEQKIKKTKHHKSLEMVYKLIWI